MNCDQLIIERLRIIRSVEYMIIILSRTRDEWATYNSLSDEERERHDQHVRLWRFAEIHGLCPPIPGTEASERLRSYANSPDYPYNSEI